MWTRRMDISISHWRQVRYITVETKEVAHIAYNRFLFLHEYSGEGQGAPMSSPEYSCGKRNLLYPIQATSFVSIILYLIYE
jgi:hypothetical protein